MQAISGNTYPVKDQIRGLGGRWDAERKVWMVPDERAAEARALVSGAPARSGSYRPRKCVACGHEERRDRRGYPIGDRILRSGECQSCYEERENGY